MPRYRLATLAGVVLTAGLVLAGCGANDPAAPPAPSGDWAAVLSQAKGQTVHWYMYGGDDALNRFVEGPVTDRLATYGVTLDQIRVEDTANAVNKVLGEQQAGRTSGGAVDAIWINGENFATGVQADLWRCGWAADLPNFRYVDASAPEIRTDFGVPVGGCESPWQQASSALVYDSAALSERDVASVSSLLDWARAHPGRFTYPAPPDFTGSMAVRTVLYDLDGGPGELVDPTAGDDAYAAATAPLWDRLIQVAPSLWRGGETYPSTQDQVERLYADGEISAFFTYGPGAVAQRVEDGVFPASTREAVPSVGNIANVSNIAIPANAAHQAAALVLANVLLDPDVQLGLYRAEGAFPAIDLDRTGADVRRRFADVATSPSVLPLEDLLRDARPELASTFISRIEKDWTSRVLQR